MASQLKEAIIKNNIPEIQQFLKKDSQLLNFRMDKGFTLLAQAVIYNKVQIVKILLHAGANASIPNDNGNTPLHFAIDTQNSKLMQDLLIEAGANEYLENNLGL